MQIWPMVRCVILSVICFFSSTVFAQKSCNTNFDCNAGMICDKSKRQCISAPGQNGGPGTGSRPTGPFSEAPHVSNQQVLSGWYGCVKGLFGPNCKALPDELTITKIMDDARKSCLKSIDPAKAPTTGQKVFEDCVDAAIKSAMSALMNQSLGGCLPGLNKIKSCVNATVTTGGKLFNDLWCETYPQDPWCRKDLPLNQDVNATISECVNMGGAKISNSQCMSCCMAKYGCSNYRNGMGEGHKAFCQGVEATCNKCNAR
jgi:hypothetical protein